MNAMHLTVSALLLAATAAAQTYTVTPHGTRCGGGLQAQVVTTTQGSALRIGVRRAQPNAVTVLVLGSLSPVPQPLPGSQCELIVDPRHTQFSMTDGRGRASFTMRLPNSVPFTFHMQAATIDMTRRGRSIESTNALQIDGV